MADGSGRRSEALRSRQARARRRFLTGGGAAAIAAAVFAAGWITFLAVDQDPADTAPEPLPAATDDDPIVSTLVIGTREDGGPAVWLTLLAYDTENDTAAVIYVPAHAAVEVPGRGLQGVGEALESGGIPLLLVSAENLLGVRIDRYVELSDRDARIMFEATGPVTVEVPDEVRVRAGRNQARLIFARGRQKLGPAFLSQLLYVRGLDADDIELGNRHVAFWHGLFEGFADEPENLGAALRSARGALGESDTGVGEHARMLTALAEMGSDRRTITTLPVQQVSVGGSELYAVDYDQVTAFMADLLEGAAGPRREVRIQVLNGNGVPGIGQEVSQRLIQAGFRIVLPGNARRFNYETTLVITYDDSPEGQALAERVRKIVGVGEVQISGQDQGIVDLTVVIGKDFLRTR